MNTEKLNNMVSWEQKKAIFLMGVAEDLGMNLNYYGELGVNPNSGNVYIWLEDFCFALYMPIHCDLSRNDVYAIVSNPYDGEEEEIVIGDMSFEEIEEWAIATLKAWEDGE